MKQSERARAARQAAFCLERVWQRRCCLFDHEDVGRTQVLVDIMRLRAGVLAHIEGDLGAVAEQDAVRQAVLALNLAGVFRHEA